MVRWLLRYTLSILVILLFTMFAYKALDILPGPKVEIPGNSPTVDPTLPGSLVTLTAIISPTMTATSSQLPSMTPAPTKQPETAEPVQVFRPTFTPRPEPYFGLQPGGPQPSVNFIKPEMGCNWMGIGGQVFDLNGLPMIDYLVHLEGTLGAEHVDLLALTGMAPQLGQGGYMIEIGSQVVESSGMLYIQIFDMHDRVLSEKISVPIYSDCEKNLILVNFVQLPLNLDNVIFLPSINKE